MERAASSLASLRHDGSPTSKPPHQWTHLPSPLPLGRFPPWLCPPPRAFPTLSTYPTEDPHPASIPERTPIPVCPPRISLCHCQLQSSRHCCCPRPHRGWQNVYQRHEQSKSLANVTNDLQARAAQRAGRPQSQQGANGGFQYQWENTVYGCSWKLAASELINENPSKTQESDGLYKLLEVESFLSPCFSVTDT